MLKDVTIVEKVLELTNSSKITWKNFKDFPPKRNLSAEDSVRVKVAVKYPKRVMFVADGYNKYQSYYAFNNDLILVLTKGARDDQLLLIAGEVELANTDIKAGQKLKSKHFSRNLSVYTNDESEGKLAELHKVVHLIPEQKIDEVADINKLINEKLGD